MEYLHDPIHESEERQLETRTYFQDQFEQHEVSFAKTDDHAFSPFPQETIGPVPPETQVQEMAESVDLDRLNDEFELEVLDRGCNPGVHHHVQRAACKAVPAIKGAMERDLAFSMLPVEVEIQMVRQASKVWFRRQVLSWNETMMKEQKILAKSVTGCGRGVGGDLMRQEKILTKLYERRFPSSSENVFADDLVKRIMIRIQQCALIWQWIGKWNTKPMKTSYLIDHDDPADFEWKEPEETTMQEEYEIMAQNAAATATDISNPGPSPDQSQAATGKNESEENEDGRSDVFVGKPSASQGDLVNDKIPMAHIYANFPNHLTLHRVAIRMIRESWTIIDVANALMQHAVVDQYKAKLEGNLPGLKAWVKRQREKATQHVKHVQRKKEKRREREA